MKENRWTAPQNRIWNELYQPSMDDAAAELCRALNVHPVTAKLLVRRGLDTPAVAQAFMNNDSGVWHDPYGMADMEKAVTRVLEAVSNHQKIAIYGDYDVDGVTSVSSLYLYLCGIGADVYCYIPSRDKEGYGVSRMGVDHLHEKGVQLIITVDTGITAREEIRYAATLGMDTVVTDHHECHAEIPVCCAVVNPHRSDCPYPFKELAGVGVVFKLICACEAKRLSCDAPTALRAVCGDLLELVAIGTIADVMPLVDENRWIVANGLSLLENTKRCGLAALLEAVRGSGVAKSADGKPANKTKRKINTGLIGYGVAPRINAAGRISHAMKAVELLLAETPERAEALAAELCEINSQRQIEENRIAEQAYRMIEDSVGDQLANLEKGEPCVVVLEHDEWMQGIIGIVASRITERYGVPSILISFEGATDGFISDDDVGKGSGRSVKGMNLVEALAHCSDVLVRFGGHELAAGLSIRRGDIPAFRERINAYAKEHLTADMTAVRYDAECTVDVTELTMPLAEELTRLEPFGVANPTPMFVVRDLTVQRMISLGAGKHTKVLLAKDGYTVPAVWFGMATSEMDCRVGDSVDVLFQLSINDYQNVRSVQMIVQDMKPAESAQRAYRADLARYQAIFDGAEIARDEDVIPSREDLAAVYTLLREDERGGRTTFSDRSLWQRVQPMGYIKMRLVLHILDELGVCHVREPEQGIFVFEVDRSAPKTNIAASTLWQRLQRQQNA